MRAGSPLGLFSGPDLRAGAESLAAHSRRLGGLPAAGPWMIDLLERSRLLGRGGAAFPAGIKWRAVASRRGGSAVVLANGAEGEPLSRKDQWLMACRPHLVLDGAFLAAGAVGAGRVVLYMGEAHSGAVTAMRRALAERPPTERLRTDIMLPPPRFVAGEETAAVNFVNSGTAVPAATPPRPFESGVEGRPTLVQNVETLAHTALVARAGRPTGSALTTIGGAVVRPGVYEIGERTTVGEALALAGGTGATPRAVLVGGYAGVWLEGAAAVDVALDPAAASRGGPPFGCGVIWVLPLGSPPLGTTAGIVTYLSSESAAQCGPCFFGLRALAEACTRLADGRPAADDLERLHRWSQEVGGRGACRHPDGATRFLRSALTVFDAEFRAAHAGRVWSAA